MRRLYVWRDGAVVGRFSDTGKSGPRFEYSEAAAAPISISLPLGGSWDGSAPSRFLEGLLPDAEADREAMRMALGAPTASTFDLLAAADSAGGLVFTKEPSPKEIAAQRAEIALEEDIALKIGRLAERRGSWQADDGRSRFSLAGTQGKFSLARIGERWFWPNARHPSTHIVKPDSAGFPLVGTVEDAVMRIARDLGVEAASSQLLSFAGQRAYVVERFDREVLPDGAVKRVHIEDFTQAMGLSRDDKYKVGIGDALRLLHGIDETGSLGLRWMDQLVFNVLVGNCDAHAKNYSLRLGALDEHGVGLCPLYDSLCTVFWENVSDDLAMPVNGKRKARDLGLSDWAAEAAGSGLDQHEVVERVAAMAMAMAGRLGEPLPGVPKAVDERLRSCIANSNASLFRELGIRKKEGIVCLPLGSRTASYAVFPNGLSRDELLGGIVGKAEKAQDKVRLRFSDGALLRTGQRLFASYVEIPDAAAFGSAETGRGHRGDGIAAAMPRETVLVLAAAFVALRYGELGRAMRCFARRDGKKRHPGDIGDRERRRQETRDGDISKARPAT